MKVIQFGGAKNARDIGGIPVRGGRFVKSGLFFRGSALSNATSADMAKLYDECRVRTIVDLRCGWERKAQPNSAHSNIRQVHIPFYDNDIVGIEYTEPAAGTKMIGRDIACVPEHFYRSLSNRLTAVQVRRAIHLIFEEACSGRAVYIHCSGGKDRAGIMTLLLLETLGATEDDILADYLFTNVARDADYDRMLERFLKFAEGDEELAKQMVEDHRALPKNITAFRESIDEEYGSMRNYIEDILEIDEVLACEIRAKCTYK